MLTPGLAVIAAKKGNWKSLFALQAAYALVKGEKFLRHTVPQATKVLYLSLELDRIALSERAQRMGPVPEGLDVLFSFSRGEDAIQDLEALIVGCGYGVIFVDMGAAIFPQGADFISYQEVTQFLLKLRKLGQEHNCCICLILHSPKGERADFADSVLGSVGFQGQADSIIYLDRKRGERVAKVFIIGNHGEDEVFKVTLGENLQINLVEDTDCVSFLPSESEAVLQALKKFTLPVSPLELVATLGRPKTAKEANRVRDTLNRLIGKGYVKKVGRGAYLAIDTSQQAFVPAEDIVV